jgi:WD40 repeat protein
VETQWLWTWDLDGSFQPVARPTLMPPTNLTYSPDGTRIAVGCYDNKVRVWDSRSANAAISLACLGNPGTGNYGFKSWLAFSPDGTRLAATDWLGRITVWHAPHAD